MVEHAVTRTLVKSQPEIWAQCSVADSLERLLSGSFGEIRITRLEPEHSVAWEGEQVRGTVKIEPSAWGTRVTMAVQLEEGQAEVIAEPVVDETPPAAETPPPGEAPPAEPPLAQAPLSVPSRTIAGDRPRARFGRWWGRLWRPPAPAEPHPPAEPAATEPEDREPAMVDPEPAAVATEPAALAPASVEAPVAPAPAELAVAPEPVAPPEPTAQPEQTASPDSPDPPSDPEAALNAALESLGQAHHRPYSRA